MRDGVWCGVTGWRLSILAFAAALGVSATQAKEPAKPQSIWEQEKLTGDWGGARTTLKDRGIDITLNYIGETFDVLAGGLQKRPSYEGRAEFSLDADLQKLIGWTGATTHLTVYDIHNSGHNVAENVGSIADPSNIDAYHTLRLFTAWYEQSFGERFSVRIGQLAGDDEFITSETAGGLINGTFGWAGILATNMTNGGPAYPLATPGARLRINPADNVSVLVGVFSGDPAGPNCNDDPQVCNAHGTTFSFYGGTLWMGELHYKLNQGEHAIGLPGIYKLGGWYATANFPDQHFGVDATGAVVSLGVDPTADPIQHRGNWGLYALADQMVWRQGDRSVNLFVRGGFSPADRNLLSWYVDGGAGFTGLLPGRPADVLTFGVAYAEISSDAVAADQDALAANGPPSFIRDHEVVFEVSYAFQIAPWWIVKPDFQYIIHPGGNVAHPDDPTVTVGNAAIFGVRSTFTF
jgi:porin